VVLTSLIVLGDLKYISNNSLPLTFILIVPHRVSCCLLVIRSRRAKVREREREREVSFDTRWIFFFSLIFLTTFFFFFSNTDFYPEVPSQSIRTQAPAQSVVAPRAVSAETVPELPIFEEGEEGEEETRAPGKRQRNPDEREASSSKRRGEAIMGKFEKDEVERARKEDEEEGEDDIFDD
jgi:hypothetical protein